MLPVGGAARRGPQPGIGNYDDGRRFIWNEARDEFAMVTSDLDIAVIIDTSGPQPKIVLSNPNDNFQDWWRTYRDEVNQTHPSPLINHGDNFSGQVAGIGPAFASGGRGERVYLYGKNGYIGDVPYDVLLRNVNAIFGR